MKKITSVVVLSCIVALNAAPALASVGAKNAAYHGGTITTFAGANDPVEGTLNLTRPDALVLTATAKDYRGREVVIPYASIVSLEYGQKAGRRVGAAVAGTVLLGPIGLVLGQMQLRNFIMLKVFLTAVATGAIVLAVLNGLGYVELKYLEHDEVSQLHLSKD